MTGLDNRKPIEEFKTPEEVIAHLNTPEGEVVVPLTGGGSRVVNKTLYNQLMSGLTTEGIFITETVRNELVHALKNPAAIDDDNISQEEIIASRKGEKD